MKETVALTYKKDYLNKIAKFAVRAKKFSKNFKNILSHLIQNGLDINFQDELGNTLLHNAVTTYDRKNEKILIGSRANNDEMVEALLALGADSEIKNNFEMSPDLNDNYAVLKDYYEPLQNSLEMDQARKTLFGQSVMNAYDLWISNENQDLLARLLCFNSQGNEFPELIKTKARSFFKQSFLDNIC